MKHNRRLRAEYLKIIQLIQIPKYCVYVHCTCSMIAVSVIKYYGHFEFREEQLLPCKLQVNLELVLCWYVK